MKMTMHRPNPRFEQGRFVPSTPVPISKSPGGLNAFEQLQSALILARNPLELTSEIVYQQPVMQYKFLGGFNTVINDPEMIKYCFVRNGKNYAMHPLRQSVLKPITREGLVSAEGEEWQRARRALSPVFTPRHINGFTNGMYASVKRELPRLLINAKFKTSDGALDMGKVLTTLTYLVLSDALFSGDISEDTPEALELVAVLLETMGRPALSDLFGVPAHIPRLTKLRGQKSAKKFREIITKTSDKRRAAKARGEILPDDFLTLMLAHGEGGGEDGKSAPFTPAELEDQMITFIGAGHETTARALSWMFYLLSNDKDARTRAEAEIDALDMDTIAPQDWGEHLPWTMACFEETMRLYPPVAVLLRTALEDDEFEGRHIPKDSAVMINMWVLHRHETLWEHPNAFDPSRFFGDARKDIGRFQYMPFGIGHRVCIGARFAMQEAAILIACMMKNYRFQYAGAKPPWPVVRVSVQADNGMPMHISKRN